MWKVVRGRLVWFRECRWLAEESACRSVATCESRGRGRRSTDDNRASALCAPARRSALPATRCPLLASPRAFPRAHASVSVHSRRG